MNKKIFRFGIFFIKPVVIAMLSGLVFIFVINPINDLFKSSETAVSIYIQIVFLGWIFFSAFLLVRADEEWKKTEEAVKEKNFDKFKIESSKKMAPSVIVSYVILAISAITSFYLFHYQSQTLGFLITAVTTFIVCLTIFVLFDLDDPLNGLIVVEDIPKEWIAKLKN